MGCCATYSCYGIAMTSIEVRSWGIAEVRDLFDLPFNDLVFTAHNTFREVFDVNKVEACTLVNIKSGKCPENCKYCPQSAHYKVDIKTYNDISEDELEELAKKSRENGVTRLCLGAAWRNVTEAKLPYVTKLIQIIKNHGLEACVTLGMATVEQLAVLKDAGLDYYNHNIDTSERYYEQVVTTRKYADRLQTVQNIQAAGLKTCCGGIVGMGETSEDRIEMIARLSSFTPHPESVPINMLIPIKNTPFEDMPPMDEIDFLRTIAVARIVLPRSRIRLSAGRENMSYSMQAIAFFIGANSIFYGEKLLTANNSSTNRDNDLFKKLGSTLSA